MKERSNMQNLWWRKRSDMSWSRGDDRWDLAQGNEIKSTIWFLDLQNNVGITSAWKILILKKRPQSSTCFDSWTQVILLPFVLRNLYAPSWVFRTSQWFFHNLKKHKNFFSCLLKVFRSSRKRRKNFLRPFSWKFNCDMPNAQSQSHFCWEFKFNSNNLIALLQNERNDQQTWAKPFLIHAPLLNFLSLSHLFLYSVEKQIFDSFSRRTNKFQVRETASANYANGFLFLWLPKHKFLTSIAENILIENILQGAKMIFSSHKSADLKCKASLAIDL